MTELRGAVAESDAATLRTDRSGQTAALVACHRTTQGMVAESLDAVVATLATAAARDRQVQAGEEQV